MKTDGNRALAGLGLYGLSQAELLSFSRPWLEAAEAGRLYGFGWSRLSLSPAKPGSGQSIRLRGLYDNDPELWGREAEIALWDQAPQRLTLLRPPEAGGLEGPIVVFANAYEDIRRQLEARGLSEYDDFLRASDFYLLYNWFQTGRIFCQKLGLIPSPRCNLRCRHCCMLSPYNDQGFVQSPDQLIADLDLLMSRVDRIQSLDIYGGEPLINKGLAALVAYAGRYRERIQRLSLITNGGLPPRQDLLAACRDFGQVVFLVSDYRDHGGPAYAARFQKTLQRLEQSGLTAHRLYWPQWFQSYLQGPGRPPLVAPEAAGEHYDFCWSQSTSRCYAFIGGRLYNCAISMFADRLGWVPEAEGDRLDFRGLGSGPAERFEIVRRYLGYCPDRYLSVCRHCYGLSPRAPLTPAAVQIPQGGQAPPPAVSPTSADEEP